MTRLLCLALLGAALAGCAGSEPAVTPVDVQAIEPPAAASAADDVVDDEADYAPVAALLASDDVPAWAADAVFYQLFPERFRNGDPSNDPTRASLETPIDRVPASWAVTPWTSDWYARAGWETEQGDDFYEDGVFDRRYGGDLQGVIDQLDYLADLGINTIYFNPVFYARSLHKYDGNSFHHIDPYFGPDPEGDLALMATETSEPATWHVTAADQLFFDLLDEAHTRGIRVIIDGVWNHTGRDFFAFDDLRRNQADSPYADWYIVNNWDDPATEANEFAYEGWWGVETLPVFADTPDGSDLHPGPKAYVFDATARWMDPDGDGDPSDGIDGWRLDVTNEVPVQFWEDWNAHVRALNPDAYTVTEIWHEAADFIEEGDFSATMNYYAFSFPVKGYLVDRAISATQFADLLNERREEYPEPVQYALQNLVDSHDTDRIASSIVNAGDAALDQFGYDRDVSPRGNDAYEVRAPNAAERDVQRLVALLQMTYVGPPMLYYGTEAGMWGADDPGDRKPMVWPDLEHDAECADPLGRERTCDEVAFDQELFDFYQSAIALRREHEALRRGTFEVLLADDERDLVAFARTLGDEAHVVVINRSDEAQQVCMPKPIDGEYQFSFATQMQDTGLSWSGCDPEQGNMTYGPDSNVTVHLPARTGAVLSRVGE